MPRCRTCLFAPAIRSASRSTGPRADKNESIAGLALRPGPGASAETSTATAPCAPRRAAPSSFIFHIRRLPVTHTANPIEGCDLPDSPKETIRRAAARGAASLAVHDHGLSGPTAPGRSPRPRGLPPAWRRSYSEIDLESAPITIARGRDAIGTGEIGPPGAADGATRAHPTPAA